MFCFLLGTKGWVCLCSLHSSVLICVFLDLITVGRFRKPGTVLGTVFLFCNALLPFPFVPSFFFQVALLLLITLSYAVEHNGVRNDGQCKYKKSPEPRPHTVSILEFGAVGDGKTSNTIAFHNAIFYLKSFADKGGAQLYVPPGRWLTGSFILTSHLTLFLERGATILGSQVLVSISNPFLHKFKLEEHTAYTQIRYRNHQISIGYYYSNRDVNILFVWIRTTTLFLIDRFVQFHS